MTYSLTELHFRDSFGLFNKVRIPATKEEGFEGALEVRDCMSNDNFLGWIKGANNMLVGVVVCNIAVRRPRNSLVAERPVFNEKIPVF